MIQIKKYSLFDNIFIGCLALNYILLYELINGSLFGRFQTRNRMELNVINFSGKIIIKIFITLSTITDKKLGMEWNDMNNKCKFLIFVLYAKIKFSTLRLLFKWYDSVI